MIKAAVKRFIIVLMLGLSPWALKAVDLPKEMKILADSAQGLLGNSRLPALNAQWMEIARELNDTTQMEAAYDNLISHYYRLGLAPVYSACNRKRYAGRGYCRNCPFTSRC